MTPKEGFTSPAFYQIALAALIGSLALVALVLNLVPILVSGSISPASAAATAGVYGLASVAGRFLGGWLMDRISAKHVAAYSTLAGAVLPIVLTFWPRDATLVTLAVVTVGISAGIKLPSIAYLVSAYFGSRSFGTLFGTISLSTSIAVGIGPLFANYLFDLTASYDLVIRGAIPGFVLSALLFASLGREPGFGGTSQAKF